MNLLFICSSLEPGRDGVGDYTRALAGELIRQHHRVAALALRDHLTDELLTDEQPLADGSLPVLRIPANWPDDKRYAQAQEWIDAFNPDWLSLQFVIYGYQPKGLPVRLGKNLARLGQGRQWHIMFHELWVGMSREVPLRFRLLGDLQRLLIWSLHRRLAPRRVHTQAQLYQQALSTIGIRAALLPLFSSIPVYSLPAAGQRNLEQQTVSERVIDLVVFGTIHAHAPIRAFAKEAADYARTHHVSVVLTLLGRNGGQQQHWVQTWEQENLPVRVLGEQSIEETSLALQQASIGISTTVFALIDKSSSVSAMHEHGLPVLCVAHPFTPTNNRGPLTFPGIVEYRQGHLADCFDRSLPKPVSHSIQHIARQLAESLLHDDRVVTLPH